ncbi:hypothetical protein [Myceligenerans cantabricum]
MARLVRAGTRSLLGVLAVGVPCLPPAAAHVLIETVEPNGDGTA